jgi:hypothetical protein
MGYIIIETTSRFRRRYELNDAELIKEMLGILENKGVRLKDDSEFFSTTEDILDIKAARRACAKGEFIDWEDAKAFLDRKESEFVSLKELKSEIERDEILKYDKEKGGRPKSKAKISDEKLR